MGTIITSEDSVSWQATQSITSGWLNDIVWNGERFVAVGDDGMVLVFLPSDIIKIKIDDRPIVFDLPPILNENEILIPVCDSIGMLGNSVEYSDDGKEIKWMLNSNIIEYELDSNAVKINGKVEKLTIATQIIDGRTYIPIKTVLESLGMEYKWDEETKTASFTTIKKNTGKKVGITIYPLIM